MTRSTKFKFLPAFCQSSLNGPKIWSENARTLRSASRVSLSMSVRQTKPNLPVKIRTDTKVPKDVERTFSNAIPLTIAVSPHLPPMKLKKNLSGTCPVRQPLQSYQILVPVQRTNNNNNNNNTFTHFAFIICIKFRNLSDTLQKDNNESIGAPNSEASSSNAS